MTVNKLQLPAKQNAVQQKINEIIDNLGTASGANADLSNLSSTGENHFQKPLIAGDNISIDNVTPITLPSGYTQLTYIESSGSQYIDTGWTYSATYPIQIDCKFTVGSFSAVSGSYPTVYGLQNSVYANWIYPLYIHNGNFMSYLGGSSSMATMPCSLNRVYDTSFTINNDTWSRTINGTTNSGSWTGSISTTDNLYLFAGSAGGSVINQLVGKIYSFKITVNNTVVRDYVPCKRNSDGVGGMYDLATSTFKPSETGAFLLGAEVTSGGEVISAIIPPPTTYNFHGVDFYSTDATTTGTITGDCNLLCNNGHFYYTSNGVSGLGEQSTDGALYVQAYNANWVAQIAQDYRTGDLYKRSKNNGTWTSWKSVSEVFVAIYGTTTYNEVLTAYNAGKTIVCKYTTNIVADTVNRFLCLEKFQFTPNTTVGSFIFCSLVDGANSGVYYMTKLDNSSVWSALNSYNCEQTSNKVTSISSSSTNTQYPSAKSVIELLKTIYPVGSVYLSTNSTCPLSSLFGTWTLVSSGRALWTGTGSNGNTTIAARLPNVSGSTTPVTIRANNTSVSNTGAVAMTAVEKINTYSAGSSTLYAGTLSVDLSSSNTIYSNSATTVQPPAYVVNVWRRTA